MSRIGFFLQWQKNRTSISPVPRVIVIPHPRLSSWKFWSSRPSEFCLSCVLLVSWRAVHCEARLGSTHRKKRYSKGDQPGTSQLGKPRTWLWGESPPLSVFPDFCAILVIPAQFRIVTPNPTPHSLQLVEIPTVSSRAWWFSCPYFQVSCKVFKLLIFGDLVKTNTLVPDGVLLCVKHSIGPWK